MFFRETVVVGVPMPVAQQRLDDFLRSAAAHAAASAAVSGGRGLLSEDAGSRGVGPPVMVETLPPRPRGDATAVSMQWLATGAVGEPLVVLDGDVELEPVSGQGVRINIAGSFRTRLVTGDDSRLQWAAADLTAAVASAFLGHLAHHVGQPDRATG